MRFMAPVLLALLGMMTLGGATAAHAQRFRSNLADLAELELGGDAKWNKSAASVSLGINPGRAGSLSIARNFVRQERVALTFETSIDNFEAKLTTVDGSFRAFFEEVKSGRKVGIELIFGDVPSVVLFDDEFEHPVVARSVTLPDFLMIAATQAPFRWSVIFEEGTIQVLLSAELRCFPAQALFESPIAMSKPLSGSFRVAFDSQTGRAANGVSLHRLGVDTISKGSQFVRGDCNLDGSTCGGVVDLITLARGCFFPESSIPCQAACDVNGDGRVCGDVTDIAFLANYCFLGSRRIPPAPFPNCGVDPSGATCEQESACPPGFASELLPLGENANGYEEYYRPRDGMVLIRLPAGQFEQGDHFLDYTLEEVPVHEVSISRDFYLGKYEVTNAQYHRFLESIGCTDPEDDDYDRSFDFDGAGANDYDGNHYPEGFERFAWARNENYFEDPSYADYPVLWVDWFDAVAYGRWADQQSSKNWEDPRAYGIPTESEWEYAARFHPSGEPRRYPWGGGGDRALDHPDSIDPRLANYGNNSGRTTAACSHPAGRSHFGLFNLSGNAYEWTADWFDGEYYGVSPRVDPFVSEGSGFRQLRGGGWFGAPFSQRGAYRCNFRPQTPDVDVGFRAVAR